LKKRQKKLIAGVVAVFIGLPLVLILALLAWGSLSDKTNGEIISSGITRRYLLYVPKSYDRSKASPLVISFHPAATWPAAERAISRWNDLADEKGFIVVYPAGSGAFFGGFSPGQHIWPAGPQTLLRDVKFISDLIEKLQAEYNIDSRRVYADGISNGGGMAFQLSCNLSDRIAAVGAVASAQLLPWQCRDSKPVPLIVFHGTADKHAPYLGGTSPIAPRPFANIPEWTAHVARKNECRGDARETQITANVRLLAYTNCAEGADVMFYTIEGGGHSWPGGKSLPGWIVGPTSQEINATRLMWEFFMTHPHAGK
jgi:polyhydroxybutyrate depolymerase